MNKLAPIVLFVYKRPWHLRQTLEALIKNRLASESELFVFADGPKPYASKETLTDIEETRKVVGEKKWCKEVTIYTSEKNLGLADSIVNGVTRIIEKYGKVIVLEDDIITSPGFLTYMNDALNQYEKHDEVMHVSAYLYPVKKSLPDTFFYNCTTCWGWGTWKKAWHNFNPDAKSLYLKINGSKREKAFNLDGAYDYLGDLNKNAEGIMHTWAVKWYASVFLKDGFCLHPGHSLTNNIGHDNSGENCIPSNRFMWNSLIENIAIKEIPFIESKKGRKAIADFSKTDTYFIVKVFNFIKKIIPSDLKSVIKRHLISSKEQKELNKIQKIPRYRNFSSKIFGYAIFATDSASFTAMYKTIFIEKIYKFISDKKNPFIIDCGANIGLGTIYFKQLYPDAKVLAFEPDQKIFDLLQKNTSNARLTKITLINKGLWNKNGKVLFSSDGIDGGKVALNKSQGNSQIEVTRLKEYLQNETVDFLKMDIEGAETIVLKDCGDALLNVNLIFIEYHSFAGQNQSLYEIMELLSNYNFRVYVTSVSYGSISPFVAVHTYAGMDMMLNIFAYRE